MVNFPVKERTSPRISVNDLALYMVSSDTARIGIIKRSKFPSAPPIIRYKDVRPVVCSFLADDMRSVNPLVSAEEMFEQRSKDPAIKPLIQDDAKKSIEVIHSIQLMSNKIAPYTFNEVVGKQTNLIISGVEVSVHLDLFAHGVIKKTPHLGAAMLRFTQDDADTDAAIKRREEIGKYTATVVQKYMLEKFSNMTPLASKLCMSIDVQHREVFSAPESNIKRISDIENACKFIASLWPSVT